MEVAIDQINYNCTPLIKIISPLIANVQMHLNVFEEQNQQDIELPTMGLINFNLCLNAETEQAHTECDSSYTVNLSTTHRIFYRLYFGTIPTVKI